MGEFAEIKKWLEMTADDELDEMGSFFARRLEGYEEHMSVWRDCYQWMAKLIPQDTESILDIGCGTGLELDEIFLLHPKVAVTAIDMEPAMLEQLRRKHGHRMRESQENGGLRLIQGDYFKVPFGEECFDVAVSFETLHHFKPADKLALFRKLHGCLKPEGCYIEADYIAESEEMEAYLYAECERRRKKSGIPEDVFVHFDTPLTLEHEMGLLREAGFGKVECLGYSSESHTPIIRAYRWHGDEKDDQI